MRAALGHAVCDEDLDQQRGENGALSTRISRTAVNRYASCNTAEIATSGRSRPGKTPLASCQTWDRALFRPPCLFPSRCHVSSFLSSLRVTKTETCRELFRCTVAS
jgi:hypothetical protein